MRISRGLNALLWWASTAVVASPQDAAAPAALPVMSRNHPRLDIFNSSALNAYVDEYKTNYVLRPRIPGQSIRRGSKSRTEEGLFSGHDEEKNQNAGVLCRGAGCAQAKLLRRQNGDSTATVVITETVVRTVSVAPAIATTIIISTVSQTLTFVNPELGTQTQVVTVTAARRRRRMASVPETALGEGQMQAQPTVTLENFAAYDALETQLSQLGVMVKRQTDEAPGTDIVTSTEAAGGQRTLTVTSTRTVEVTSTVTVTGTVTVTSTVFNTVFVTATVAPSATSTVFTTTTIRPPQVTGGNDVPGGVIPPTGGGTIFPENPTLLPSGSLVGPSGTLLPPGAGSNPPLPSGTQVPPGSTGVLPPGSPTQTGNPQSMAPPGNEPTETEGPSGPVSPFPGSNLTSDQIAGIVLGAVFGIFFILLAAFLIRRCTKRKQRKQLAKDHQDMASAASGTLAAAAVAAGGRSGRTGSTHERPTLGPSDSSSGPPGEGEVRIVIRPAPKRRTQSSGLFPLAGPSRIPSGTSFESGATRSQWPRPPGYSGQTYSFFIEESGATTPQDPNQWSVASEYGSASAAASVNRTSGAYTGSNVGGGGGSGGNTQYNSYSNYSQDERNYTDERDNSGRDNNNNNNNSGRNNGAGGGEYLTVGRALSPWNPI